MPMDPRLVSRRASCPYCGERIELLIDLSADGTRYIEDCQVCCRPMGVSFESVDGEPTQFRVERSD